MKKYMMADVDREEFTGAIILTTSQDRWADEKAKSLAIEAKKLVDYKKNKTFFYGLTEEQYRSYVSQITRAAKATFSREEVADAWEGLCWAIFDDYLYDGILEYEDVQLRKQREAEALFEKKLALKLEKKNEAKKESMNRKAARKSKLNERRW